MITCKARQCEAVAWYSVSRQSGTHYAVIISSYPIYCDPHAHATADRRALRIQYGTSAHIRLQDHEGEST